MSPRRASAERAASATISRRRFVSLLATGSAALAATPVLAAKAAASKRPKPAAPPSAKPAMATAALQKEFDRQRTGTLDALKKLREYPLPPGGELAVVFRPLHAARKER